ncbi:hypothetical protein [Methanobrevibacter filiformis]|uniref:Uncharacterized protein n=1 Tax=Methanobrevibacter filiformis TaxID=55758 RepID=A0A166CXR8_9EURY|nr:hypothetical protein [Methanobrevibacter filiformis]KZX17487.1 hypothetical protein MBFIL_01450 [Methanobrevibacter filiformis]
MSIRVSEKTRQQLETLKYELNLSNYDEVIKLAIKNIPHIVKTEVKPPVFVLNSITKNKEFEKRVYWDDLEKAKTGDIFKYGSDDVFISEEFATVLFKDENGVFIRLTKKDTYDTYEDVIYYSL